MMRRVIQWSTIAFFVVLIVGGVRWFIDAPHRASKEYFEKTVVAYELFDRGALPDEYLAKLGKPSEIHVDPEANERVWTYLGPSTGRCHHAIDIVLTLDGMKVTEVFAVK